MTDPFAAATAGRVEARARADVAALVTAHPMGESLAELAYWLARQLDMGPGKEGPGYALQLRMTLVELARLGVESDDDFEAGLSAPVRDAPDPGAADAGPGDR